jgi:hypothetical protein
MESERVPAVGPRETYVSAIAGVPPSLTTVDPTAGSGKSTLLYVVPQFSMDFLTVIDISN